MPISWAAIHDLEVRECYPAVIEALEERLRSDPSEAEAVIRLGFNLWYAYVEHPRMTGDFTFEPVKAYPPRFMELFSQYRTALIDNADFCWAFGQGIQMFWYFFPGATEEMGKALIDRACELDSFWARFWSGDNSQAETTAKLKGRGVFQSYYNIQ